MKHEQNSDDQGFFELGPNEILNIVAGHGYRVDGRILALNSYENRVYRLGIDDVEPIIVKFYRPGRWSDDAILEEHRFTEELYAAEIPVVAPVSQSGKTLFHAEGHRFAVYPCFAGRAPELDNSEQLEYIGRYMANLHNIGSEQSFNHRPTLSVQEFVIEAQEFLLQSALIPMELESSYRAITNVLIEMITAEFSNASAWNPIRLHGDAHIGNFLVRDEQYAIMDFDDARMGPAIQDIWMFLSGDQDYMSARLRDFIRGYQMFRPFDARQLCLIEPLRCMRLIYHSYWIAKRWTDPAFPQAFPYFESQRYWEEHILSLREQQAVMQEPPQLHIDL